jgi:hypothetical protein
MIYNDPVYGPTTIDTPVLLDIMNSKAIQRLNGVLQHGVSAIVGITRETTRFEHSIGVMLLVQRLGANLEEQIAALLHDVSHTAFSHVIDYVFDGHDSQKFHEDHKLEYVSGTDIPDILDKHGFYWMDFMQEENFTLLEQALPHLCADRLDYFLRDARDLGLATDREVSNALKHLIPHQGRILVDNLEVARWLGYTFIEGDKASWANFREVGLYELAAQSIRRGLEIGVLTKEDIWGTDRLSWEKLRSSTDPVLQHHFKRVNPNTIFVRDEDNPEFLVSTKLRSIDPDVYINQRVSPLSTLDRDFAHYRNEYLTHNSGKWPMRVIVSDE